MHKALEKSYLKALERCKEAGVEPAFSISEFEGVQVGTKFKYYQVRCLKCGHVFSTTFRPGHMLKCVCDESSFYSRAKKYAERCGFSLVEGADKFPNLYGEHPVKCNLCGKVEMHQLSGYYFKCECQKFSPYLRAVELCKKFNLKLLVSEDNYRGRRDRVRVKCMKCGTEYDALINNDSCTPCCGCKEEHEYNESIDQCKAVNITPLFSRNDFKGYYSNDGKSNYYLVKCNVCGTEYESAFGVNKYPNMCPRCKQASYRSQLERVLTDKFKGLNVLCNYKDRRLTFGGRSSFELDLYFPDYGVAFELNGYYWHCSLFHDREYHRRKTEVCLQNGIKLYHLWESTSLELMESVIRSKLNLNNRIFARSLSVVEDNKMASKFFDDSHVDGTCKYVKCWSLEDSEIRCAIALRFTKDGFPEIARFASQRNITVVGGYSRLLKHLILYLKCNYPNCRYLISYCNRDLSPDGENTFYSKYGFKFIDDVGPIMKYFTYKDVNMEGFHLSRGINHRQKLQKHKLVEALIRNNIEFHQDATEEELAVMFNSYRVWNSGNFKYSLNLKQ